MRKGLINRVSARVVMALVVASLVVLGSTSTVSNATAAPEVSVAGHAAAVLVHATMLSRLPADHILELTIAVRPRSDHALADAVAAANRRMSKRLTVDELGSAIGQSPANVAMITSYFRACGLTVEPLAADQLSFRVSGTVANVERALSVTFGNYRTSDGIQFYSTDGEPSLPGDIASVVQAIYGLDNFPALHRMNRRVDNFAGEYAPADMRTAYDVNPLYTAGFNGTGETIGILGCDDFATSDIVNFENIFGMPSASITRVTIDDGATGSDPEPTIDLEWSLAIAPNASIIYYGFSSSGGCSFSSLVDAMSRVVSDNQASVVSISLGACENDFQGSGFLQGVENELQAAAALGQSVMVSTGDNGAYTPCAIDTTNPVVSYPASSAFVTAVGGTSLTTNPNSSYAGETAWGSANGCSDGGRAIQCGSGEGISQAIAEPSWQSAAPIMSTGGHRGLADVSWNSDPQTGNVLYITFDGICNGLCGGWGGTSIAAPQWAGLAALADQAAGKRLGLLGPMLYSSSVLAQQASPTGAPYHDVTQPQLAQSPPGPLLFPAGTGWDLPTGWGSSDAFNLVQAILVQQSLSATPTSFPTNTPVSRVFLPIQFADLSAVAGGW